MPTSSVFCALGSAMMRGQHVYEMSAVVTLQKYMEPTFLQDYAKYNKPVNELMRRAISDMKGEGYKEDEIQYTLELEMKWGGTQIHTITVFSPVLTIQSDDDVKRVIDAFEDQYAAIYGRPAVFREAGAEVLTFRLRSLAPSDELILQSVEEVGENADHAIRGKRLVYWRERGDFAETPIYSYGALKAGNRVQGPAILNARDTTVVVPPGHRLRVDTYLHGFIKRD
jgi:N-methylhydantoinase A/oxoprolinase/acetone carboxylase beta subunit